MRHRRFKNGSAIQVGQPSPLHLYILPEVYLRPSRQVQSKEGEILAKQNHAAWVETSAKDDANICKFILLCIFTLELRSTLSS